MTLFENSNKFLKFENLIHIRFSDRIFFFRFNLDFQISKLDLRFQNEFKRLFKTLKFFGMIMKETELSHDSVLKLLLRPFEVVEVKRYSWLNFKILTSIIHIWLWKNVSYRKKCKANFCVTNGQFQSSRVRFFRQFCLKLTYRSRLMCMHGQ